MAEQMLSQSACRSIWALLEIGDARTFDYLVEVTDQPETLILAYMQLLERQAYLGIAGLERSSGGELIPSFLLIKRTGRQAPFVDDEGQFVDPNLPSEHPRWGVSPKARVRLIAETFSTPFTLDELRDSVARDKSEFKKISNAIWKMKNEGELVEVENGWEFRTDARVIAIRDVIKRKFIGQSFMVAELEEIFVDKIKFYTIRRVFAELKVEGFKITLLRPVHDGRKKTAYLVEAS
jgi:hypothetical protein